MFEKVNIQSDDLSVKSVESFNFIFCEGTTCPECCDYFVTIKPVEIINGSETDVTATISNGRIVALTQSLCECSNDQHKPKDTELKDVILMCGQGNGSAIFRNPSESAVRIANVTIDTSRLCKPKVLVEFSSIINYAVTADSNVGFQFELFRVCNNGEPVLRGSWTFEVGLIEGIFASSTGFGFTFCECVNFSGCCEYFVELKPIEVPVGRLDNIMISNSKITALVQSTKTLNRSCNFIDSEDHYPKTKKILFACGNGTGNRTFTSSDDSAFQLAQVTVDTTCLCKPVVNIEFSSIVSFIRTSPSLDLNGLLLFELFRVCDDGHAESRGIWTVAKIDLNSSKFTESFDFTFCEPIKCKSGCCTYFVKVTPTEIENGQVSVSNGRIAALVQEG